MSLEEQTRLSQNDMFEWLKRDMQLNDMITVYFSEDNGGHNCGIYCALIPSNQIEQALSKPTWDLSHGHGLPGAIEYYKDGEKHVQYWRYGDDDGIEPLVLDREFYGIKDNYKEISEEFRLFHRLYHDRKENK